MWRCASVLQRYVGEDSFMVTTRSNIYSPISLHGRRVVLRTMTRVIRGLARRRERCHDWLLKWDPRSATRLISQKDQR